VLEPVRARRRRRRLLPAALLAALIAGGVAALLSAHSSGANGPPLVPRADLGARDVLAFGDDQVDDLERAAASGLAHVLYVKSPGGVLAAAARTARFRGLVEQATEDTGVDPDLLEAMVLLESGGRPEAIAGSDPARATGLTQILAETAQNFLGMHVELEVSRRLTRGIAAAVRAGDSATAERLRERRRRADARFEPAKALAGAVRYLTTAFDRFGRDDLAAVSYHMGIGNLESVLRDYTGVRGVPIADVVADQGLSWARLYFDASPARHAAAWRRLSRFGDDSQTYYWRVLAAREIMRLYRDDRDELERLIPLHKGKASSEDALHPPDRTERFADLAALERAWRARRVQPLPDSPARLGFRIDPQLGARLRRLGKDASLYRGLQPEALAVLLYISDRVRALSGAQTPLVVAGAVRDEAGQRMLGPASPESGQAYSLHAAGYAFDIRRRYGSSAQASAFQYVLERLQARGLIAWIRQPKTIHVTVAADAESLVDAMLRPAS
jgi:hypothetical protein